MENLLFRIENTTHSVMYSAKIMKILRYCEQFMAYNKKLLLV